MIMISVLCDFLGGGGGGGVDSDNEGVSVSITGSVTIVGIDGETGDETVVAGVSITADAFNGGVAVVGVISDVEGGGGIVGTTPFFGGD